MAQSGTVLIIDDEARIVAFLRHALEDEGYVVVDALGEEALHRAARLRPGVILLDLRMPVLDGREVCRCLRADPATATIPLILISADPQLTPIATALAVNAWLAKPLDLDELYATVARWMAVSHAARLHWHRARGQYFAFDRTARRVLASCLPASGAQWRVVLRVGKRTYGPYATLEQAESAAERLLLS